MGSLTDIGKVLSTLEIQYRGREEYESTIFVPSEKNLESLLKKLHDQEIELNEINRVKRNNLQWLQTQNVIQAFTFVVEDDQSYPNRYISPLVCFIENIVKRDNRQYLKRSNILSKKIR